MNDFAINNDHHFSSPSIANLHFFDDDDDDDDNENKHSEADKQQQTNSNRMYFTDENQTKTNVQHLSSSWW